MSVSFGLASTHGCASSISAEHRRAGRDVAARAGCLSTCVAMPAIGARSDGVVEIALAPARAPRGLPACRAGYFSIAQVGIAEQLVAMPRCWLLHALAASRDCAVSQRRVGAVSTSDLRSRCGSSSGAFLRSTSRCLMLDAC